MIRKKKKTFNEYRKAADRHIDTCEFMLENVGKLNSNKRKEDILFDIYYLSGSIIECTLKYVFFSNNDDTSINNEYFSGGKNHYFDTLKQKLAQINIKFSANIPVLSNKNIYRNDKVGQLIKDWHPGLKYSKRYLKYIQ